MDLTILTTFFCLILLVLSVLALNELMILKRKVNAHLDRSDLHSDKLATILSILQQIEAKQDLIFNNAPPAPGEYTIPEYTTLKDLRQSKEDAPEEHSWHYPVPSIVISDETWKKASKTALEHANVKVSSTVPREKKPDVVKAAKKAKADFDARLPYHMSKIDNGVIPLEAPKRGARLGVKRGPYKKKQQSA